MSLISQHEWYRERAQEVKAGTNRNSELDALNAFAELKLICFTGHYLQYC